MLQKIVFPLAHDTRKVCRIKPEEQVEIASRFDLTIERVQDMLASLAQEMSDGKVPPCRSESRLRRYIQAKIEREIKPKGPSMKQRIEAMAKHPGSKFAVFMRSASGTGAHFRVIHESQDVAVDVARQHAAEMVSRGHPDFTYYVVELKHRVGIEDNRLVDKPMA